MHFSVMSAAWPKDLGGGLCFVPCSFCGGSHNAGATCFVVERQRDQVGGRSDNCKTAFFMCSLPLVLHLVEFPAGLPFPLLLQGPHVSGFPFP